jgi:hypothetical protein
MTLHVGQLFLAAPANQPFTLDMIPDDTIPAEGLIRDLQHWRDPDTGYWVVGWIREEGFND